MEPFVTVQILRAAGLIVQKLDALADKLDTVVSKQDQLISREVKAAYSALKDSLLSSNPGTREQRIAFAEDNLLKNTKLNLNLQTEGISNRELIATAHYGLSFITLLRNDETIAARHLLQCFEVDPRLSREVLAPQLYKKLFLPQCKEIISESKEELDAVDEVGTEREAPATLVDHATYYYNKLVGDDPDIVTQADYDAEVGRIEEEREQSIDERCSEVARELLGS